MARKSRTPNFEQMLDALRAHSFDVTPYKGVADGVMVSKGGVAAVLVPGKTNHRWESGGARLAVTPGVLVKGEICASARPRLPEIHQDRAIRTAGDRGANCTPSTTSPNELNLVTGAMGLYNESLGTTSDVYEYDRLRAGRAAPAPARPWD